MSLFENETAIVTGAASNIGAAIAERLAGEGCDVALVDINGSRLTAVADRIKGCVQRAHVIETDLATKSGWRTVVDKADSLKPTMFVHSACPPRCETDTVASVTEETFDEMMNVNVRSGFFLAREIGLAMQTNGTHGRLIFVSSLHQATPRNLPHYSAAKAGMTMLTQELARYFGPSGIRVNAIAPGAVPGGGFQPDHGFDQLRQRIPMKRAGRADEIAATAITLLSDAHSSYVTGVTMPVDGGLGQFNWIDMPDSSSADASLQLEPNK